MNERSAKHDTTLPCGGGPDGTAPVLVKKGTMVMCSIWALHRDQELWGADANEWVPERWTDLTRGANGRFCGFGGGLRICVGRKFTLQPCSFVAGLGLQGTEC